jgi:predicted anti-sigma-YlaC factor YlaD
MPLAASKRTCARARRAFSLVLDREAAASDVRALAEHLGRCEGCRRYAEHVADFTRDLRSLRLGPLDNRREIHPVKGKRS